MTATDEGRVDAPGGPGIRAAVFVSGVPEEWLTTLQSLREHAPGVEIVLGAAELSTLGPLADLDVTVTCQPNPANLVDHVYRLGRSHVLVLAAPAAFPPGALERALDLVDTDLRVSSVSFLSNIADYAGFPVPDVASIHQVEDLDEVAITRRLRAAEEGLDPVPIPYPVGPAVLVSTQALSLVHPFPDRGDRVPVSLAEFGALARARGMLDMLDPSTFVARPTDVPGPHGDLAGLAPAEADWLAQRYPGIIRAAHDPVEEHSALRQAVQVARATTFGLRIVLDGSCIGPKPMGHQVTFLAMAAALAARDDVDYLGIAVPGPIPGYATAWLDHPTIEVRQAPAGRVDGFPRVDIVHRPYQVVPGVDARSWREVGARTLITQHDLIAFQVPDYHGTPENWFAYRSATRSNLEAVDGLVAISEDTRRQIALERLPVEASRVFVVPNGIDHLTGREPEREPAELAARGFNGQPFLLVLGTNYTHKNRDLAIHVTRELTRRGHPLALVMAGALVPYGSSRVAEAAAWAPGEPVYTVPDVTDDERNWLLRHAEVVLYPSGAEGFGLIPNEAAAFGTPTVVVPFGPFRERMADLPVAPADWGVDTLADACAELLLDPLVAKAQIEAINASLPSYDWPGCAKSLVEVYRSLLVRPPLASL